MFAERIPKVHAPNNLYEPRVDFFIYCMDGSIARYHPGAKQTDISVHNMPPNSFLVDLLLLRGYGAGDRETAVSGKRVDPGWALIL